MTLTLDPPLAVVVVTFQNVFHKTRLSVVHQSSIPILWHTDNVMIAENMNDQNMPLLRLVDDNKHRSNDGIHSLFHLDFVVVHLGRICLTIQHNLHETILQVFAS